VGNGDIVGEFCRTEDAVFAPGGGFSENAFRGIGTGDVSESKV